MSVTDRDLRILSKRRASRVIPMALFLIVAIGCVRKDTSNRPVMLLSEQQMVEILSDAHIIEADMNYLRSLGKERPELHSAYYDQLFRHYGIDEKVLSENMEYYTRLVEVMERIMDSVLSRLTLEQKRNADSAPEPSPSPAASGLLSFP